MYYNSYGSCSPTGIRTPYLCNPCLVKESGKIRHIIFYDADSEPDDPSSFSAWSALISAGKADLIQNINGSYDGGTTEEIDGYGDKAVENGNTTRIAEIHDPNWFNNQDHYEYAKNANDRKAAIVGAKYIRLTGAVVNISVKDPIDISSKGFTEVVMTIKWENQSSPRAYLRPTDLFTECRSYLP